MYIKYLHIFVGYGCVCMCRKLCFGGILVCVDFSGLVEAYVSRIRDDVRNWCGVVSVDHPVCDNLCFRVLVNAYVIKIQ